MDEMNRSFQSCNCGYDDCDVCGFFEPECHEDCDYCGNGDCINPDVGDTL